MPFNVSILNRYLGYHFYNSVHFNSFRTVLLPLIAPAFTGRSLATYTAYVKDFKELKFPKKLVKPKAGVTQSSSTSLSTQLWNYTVFMRYANDYTNFLAKFCPNTSVKSVLAKIGEIAKEDHKTLLDIKDEWSKGYEYIKDKCDGMFGN